MKKTIPTCQNFRSKNNATRKLTFFRYVVIDNFKISRELNDREIVKTTTGKEPK